MTMFLCTCTKCMDEAKSLRWTVQELSNKKDVGDRPLLVKLNWHQRLTQFLYQGNIDPSGILSEDIV